MENLIHDLSQLLTVDFILCHIGADFFIEEISLILQEIELEESEIMREEQG